jgi:hypothetical protein
MPFHWCADETIALFSALPFIGYFFAKLHAWYHKKFGHPCHTEGCSDTHVEHTTHEKSEQSTYNPGNDWDALSQDDMEERFGGTLIDNLIGDHRLLGVDIRPHDEEFSWFINGYGGVRAKFRDKTFTIDDELLWYQVQ